MTLLPVRLSCIRRLLGATIVTLTLSLSVRGASLAFPGAEGFGANASGGRGGTVYHVTNLNDSGAGSFRDAVSVAGRTVVFDVGGVITLTSPVVLKSNLTVAGQTAPGGGITLYGDRLGLSGVNNLIIRYLRVREGINGDSGTDAISADSGDRMIFDHVSASWGRDETFSFNGTPSNITLQDCIIGQGLLVHSAGGLVQTSGGVSIFRCLYIDNWMRNPKVKGVNDYQNNVVYNWGAGGGYIPAGDSAGLSFANLINNYFIAGQNTGSEGPFKTGNQNYNLYHAGNFQDLNVNGALDGTAVTDASFPTLHLVATPFSYAAPATLLTAQQALAHVIANAGASLHRDSVDSSMLAELTSFGTVGIQIFNESEVGGVGTIAGGLAPKDTDGDGMPDYWEEAAGTNPLVADNNGDINGDGYTNLENYLNSLVIASVPAVTIDGIASDTGSSSNDGITSDNSLVLRGTAAAGATVTLSRIDTSAIGAAVADGTGQWSFDYTGTPLADRFYAFTATATLAAGGESPPTRAFVVKVDTAAAAAPTITSIVTTPSFLINGTSEPGSAVSVTLVGTGVVGTAVTNELGNWSATYSGAPLPPGAYAFTAAAVDLGGNAGAASAPYAINTSLAAPVFTSIVSDSGTAGDFITNDPSLIFNGTSFANAIVTLTRAGVGVIGTATANGTGAWSFSYEGTPLAAGTHTFTATAATGGSSSPASAPRVVTIDTTRPTVSSIRRQNPTVAATTGSTLVYRVTFAEPVTGVDATDFVLTLSGATATLSSLTPVSSTVYDVTVTGASGDGTVRLDLKASGTGIADVAGNLSNAAFTAGQTYTIRLPGSGVWISDEVGGLWSNAANWENTVVANGTGATADFSSLNLDGVIPVQLDSARTIGRVVFGDTDFGTPTLWLLGDNGSAANVLTLAGSNPTIQVNAATTTGDTIDVPAANAFPTTLDAVLAGTAGFTKSGVGTVLLTKPNTISGPLTITKGIVEIGVGGSLTPTPVGTNPSVTIATSQQLRVSGGTFSTAGDITWNSGTGTGIIVSAGTASFQKIRPSNTRNSFFRVSGGVATATELNFPRSGDSEVQALAAGIFITGGDTTINTVGLGTADSWGSLAVSGGRLTVTDVLHNAFQVTSTRGGVINVSGGELNVTSAATGLIMSRNPVTDTPARANNPNQVSKLIITGGVSNIARLALGYDATSSAGSATVSLANGELNLGAGSLVKNGALASTVTLNSGTLGAIAPWSSSVPMTVAGAPGILFVRAGTAGGAPFDIELSGVLSGAGGFTKTGAGQLTLSGASTFAGGVAVDAGVLRISGSLAAGGPIDINAGGALIGDGTVSRTVNLNGTIAPNGAVATAAFHGEALTWNSGGRLAFDLGVSGVSNQLVLTGALTKGSSGLYLIALNAGSGLAVGNIYTVATFGSTDFIASDFTVTGLPAGYAAAVTLNSTSLQLTIVGQPFITSPAAAGGTFGAPFSYGIVAGNTPTSFSAAGLPAGLSVDPVTGVISGSPAATGTFNVTLGATNIAGTGNALLTLTITKATTPIALGDLKQAYDGTAKSVSATTNPAGLNVVSTYNGNATATLPGVYAVVSTVDDLNYSGTVTGQLEITITALVRHAPNLNGNLDGSLQLLSGESFALNGNSYVAGDLLVPGTPATRLNGHPSLLGTRDETGAVTPSNYTVTLNGNALARYIVRRVDPIAFPTVTAPVAPAGTRNVVLNNSSQNPGDFATLRNLTLNGSVGTVVIPAGAYGDLTANGNSGFILGDATATEPSVYHLQRLTLNGTSSLQVVGPVVIKLANGLSTNATLGANGHVDWLKIEISNGGLNLNGGALHGEVVAPVGNISINGQATLHGRVMADRLTINGGGLLTEDTP